MGVDLKVFFFVLVLIAISVFLSYGFRLERAEAVCNRQFQDSLDTIQAQAQTVLADRRRACTSSYEVLTEWDACISKAERETPEKFTPVLSPVVSNVMMFIREKQKDISVLKKEHDERCKDYKEVLFYPDDEP